MTSKDSQKTEEVKSSTITHESPSPTPPAKEEFNTAIVSDGGNEVRRYTLDNHGENFSDLANKYAGNHKGYKVEIIRVMPGVACPSCGYQFNP